VGHRHTCIGLDFYTAVSRYPNLDHKLETARCAIVSTYAAMKYIQLHEHDSPLFSAQLPTLLLPKAAVTVLLTAVVVILNLNSTVTGSTRCGRRVTLSFELFTHIKIITAQIFDIEITKSMDMKDENRRCFPKESATSVANSVKPSSN